jgi:carbon storage regulator
MLVLSRKQGEKVVIPEAGITLTVLEVRGERIRLGIEAPPNLAVLRQEVLERDRLLELPG